MNYFKKNYTIISLNILTYLMRNNSKLFYYKYLKCTIKFIKFHNRTKKQFCGSIMVKRNKQEHKMKTKLFILV